jgi:hypothetical protein
MRKNAVRRKFEAANATQGVKKKQRTVAEFLRFHIDNGEKKQREIAQEIGYDQESVISMIKYGRSKLPLYCVGPMAKALGLDPMHLLSKVLSEYTPENWEIIQRIMGFAVTDNEREIIVKLRELTNESNPKLQDNSQHRQAIKSFAAQLTRGG